MIKALGLIYLIWGFNWVIMKEANVFFPPVFFVACRFTLGAGILLLVVLWRRIPLPPRHCWKWIIITGALMVAANNAAAQIGMQSLSAGLVAVLNYSMPIWVAILAHLFLQEKLTQQKIAGILLSMIGLFILMHIDTCGSLPAMLLVLAGAFSWAIANVLMKRRLQDCDMLQYTAWQLTAGALLLDGYTAFTGIGSVEWNALSIGCLLYNGVLASALAFFLWSWILAHMEASKASIAVLAVPVVGVLAGILILGEAITIHTALGMLLILTGILLVVRPQKKSCLAAHK